MATILDLERDLAALTVIVNGLQSEVTALENAGASNTVKFSGIESRLANLETCCEESDTDVSDLKSTVNSLQTTTAQMQANIATLNTSVSSIPAQFTSVTNSVNENAASISELADTAETIQTVVSGVQSSIAGVQSSVSGLQSAQTNANGKITALETKAAGLETSYASQAVEITALKASDVKITADVTKNTTAIKQINDSIGNVSTMRADIDELDQRVKDVEEITDGNTTAIADNTSDIAVLQNKAADSGWNNMTLINGATTVASSQRPQYRKVGSRVYLRGVFKGVANPTVKIAILPVGFRPSMRMIASAVRANFETARIEIETDGSINYVGSSTNVNVYSANNWHSLEDISFAID